MEGTKNKFNSLTPEVLNEDEKKQIYIEALDYAFKNKDIKNIAITGIYGAGKSSVWRTYVKDRNISNVVTVSLGKYEEDNGNLESSNHKEKDNKKQKVLNLDNDNRIEKQLINQILSQIKYDLIPLSKYRFKINKSSWKIFFQSVSCASIILALVLWLLRKPINDMYKNFNLIYFGMTCMVLFLLPVTYFLSMFFREDKFKISKINFKGAEANFDGDKNDDESVLDRDIKEIVYLLNSSETKIVVVEDLDRYDNLSIFTKLRELNFLINKYSNTNGKNDVIKFIYMVKDGLFISKNRTKFFDFIIPIVPVIDSRNSENILMKAIERADNKPDKKIITKISIYIDDMRLLKNIVNEFLIYENVISIKELNLDSNKLLALMVLKNIFPLEFELLQQDKGYIYTLFTKLDEYKNSIRNSLENKITKINTDLNYLKNRHENSKFEAMAAMISPNVYVHDFNSNTSWTEFLKEKSLNPDEKFRIYSVRQNGNSLDYFTYEEFVNKYILTTTERKELISKLPLDKNVQMHDLLVEKILLEKQIREISLCTVEDELKIMSEDEVNDAFFKTEDAIIHSHYFPLIRFLIMEGLIDETYWYYKGCFYKGSLGKNDTIFMKNLLESKKQDIFLNIENAEEVKDRLNIDDFHRFNILNKKLLEICIVSNSEKEIIALMESTKVNDNYESLIQILDTYNYPIIKKFVSILIMNHADQLIEILDRSMTMDSTTFKNILISIYTNINIEEGTLKLFSSYIEKNENIISLIKDIEFETFIKNISIANIKFKDISKSKSDKLRIKRLEKIKAYRLNFKNVKFVSEKILDNRIDDNKLISVIFNSEELMSTMDYIEENFEKFIILYIDENSINVPFYNDENIVIKIINSDLPNEYKLKYIKSNKIVISDITKLNDLENNISIVEALFSTDNVLFDLNNINAYWESIEFYNEEFTKYVDRHIDDNNYREILLGNIEISNSFINCSFISDKIFNYSLICANNKISNIDEKISKERIQILINKNMISITGENIKMLLQNSYYQEITDLINSKEQESENEAIDILLNFELEEDLIYRLVNSDISFENSKKLINQVIDEILIEKINFKKKSIIEYLIDYGLSDANINYICKHFSEFKLKDKFVEYLDVEDKFSKIKNESMNDSFVQFVLLSNSVSVDSKINLIIIKIKSEASINEVKELISNVKEISELADVWNNKRPLLDNFYKEKIGDILAEVGYVSKRNDRDCVRIMELKKMRKKEG